MSCINCFTDPGPSACCGACGYAQAEPMRDKRAMPAGTLVFGKYRIGRLLGSGGAGITYLARDEQLGRRVALKEFVPSGLAGRAADGLQLVCHSAECEALFHEGLKRFFAEGQILGRFDHPHIVRVVEVFEAHATAYTAMEFLEGATLKALLVAGGPWPEQQALDALAFMLEALAVVHAQHVIHRDIKPDNVYVTLEGRTLLLDFGGAKQLTANPEHSTGAMFAHGYAAPEQYFDRSDHVGPWTDIYACGATLYKLLTGNTPRSAYQHRDDGPQLDWAETAVSLHTRKLVARAMSYHHQERIQDAPAMLALLRDPAAFDATDVSPTPPPPPPPPPPPGPEPARMPVRTGIALGCTALAVLAVALVARPLFRPAAVVAPAAQASAARPAACAARLATLTGDFPTFRAIPAGTYRVGLNPGGGGEQAGGAVISLAEFGMAETETTRGQWQACVNAGACRPLLSLAGIDAGTTQLLPVTQVSWDDAQGYAAWLGRTAGARVRLPSEAEWEYAARGGNYTVFPWGDVVGMDRAHCAQCNGHLDTQRLAPVKSYPSGKNAFGLYDMLGNAWEWSASCWTARSGLDAGDGQCPERVQKGGGFNSLESDIRPVHRAAGKQGAGDPEVGFRVVCQS